MSEAMRQILERAARSNFTGDIRVVAGPDTEGLVVFYKGRIGWVVSSEQSEDLGTFLLRLGRLTKDQLSDVRQRFEQYQGTRKLGQLLEEAGLVRKTVLQRALRLHARMALASILRFEDIQITSSPVRRQLDAEVTFSLKETLPEGYATESVEDDPSWSEWHEGNEVLKPLLSLDGYLASAIISSQGRPLSAHASLGQFDPEALGLFLASALESSSRSAVATFIGPVGCLALDCEQGKLFAQWLDQDRRRLAVVVTTKQGRLGAASALLRAQLRSMRRYLSRSGAQEIRRAGP